MQLERGELEFESVGWRQGGTCGENGERSVSNTLGGEI